MVRKHTVFRESILVRSVEEDIHIDGYYLGSIAEHFIKHLTAEVLRRAVVIKERNLVSNVIFRHEQNVYGIGEIISQASDFNRAYFKSAYVKRALCRPDINGLFHSVIPIRQIEGNNAYHTVRL